MYYQLYELNHALIQPWRAAAEAARYFYSNPLNPLSQTAFGSAAAAAAEVFERTTRRYGKPVFGFDGTTVDGFRPGYSAGYARAGDVRADWLRLRLPDGTALCFWPRFGWDAGGHYVLDVISERYAILSLERRF